MRIQDLDDDSLAALYPASAGVRVNFVASLDGAVSVAGSSTGLSSPADRRVFRLLRKQCDALLVGAGTFRAEIYRPQPQLVVLSRSLRLDPGHPALAGALILTARKTLSGNENPALARVAEIVRCDDVAHGLRILRERGLTRILCEGGPTTFGALTAADLVDELCLTLSPLLAGPEARRIIDGTPHEPRDMRLVHVLTADDGIVLLRYQRGTGTS